MNVGVRATSVGLLLCAFGPSAWAEPSDRHDEEARERRSPWSLFPILAYAPETSAMLGAGVVYTFEADSQGTDEARATRRSAIALASAYTLNRQFFVSIAPSVYWDAEAWHAEGTLSGKRFPSTFYPVGWITAAARAEDYTERAFGAAARLTRRLAGSFRSGGEVGVFQSTITKTQPGGDLDRDRVVGSGGGRLVGFGPVLVWDDRDNDFATRHGGRYSLSADYFADTWGSSFNVSKYELDARQFFSLGGEHVLAAQVYAVANLGSVPFQTMAALGGSNRMRGYFEGRFRDLCMWEVQVEWRFPLFWRFGAAVFGGAGDVAHEITGLRFDDPKLAGGGGLRFALNQADRVNLRLDAAGTATGDLNFYVTLGEAF